MITFFGTSSAANKSRKIAPPTPADGRSHRCASCGCAAITARLWPAPHGATFPQDYLVVEYDCGATVLVIPVADNTGKTALARRKLRFCPLLVDTVEDLSPVHIEPL